MKGKEANTAITIQENTVKTKASLILILFFWCLKEKYKTNPMIKVIRLEKKKICQSEFWYAISISIGKSIAMASMHKSNPII